jgi:hypothetical protein
LAHVAAEAPRATKRPTNDKEAAGCGLVGELVVKDRYDALPSENLPRLLMAERIGLDEHTGEGLKDHC